MYIYFCADVLWCCALIPSASFVFIEVCLYRVLFMRSSHLHYISSICAIYEDKPVRKKNKINNERIEIKGMLLQVRKKARVRYDMLLLRASISFMKCR